MRGVSKTKKQVTNELAQTSQRIAELDVSEAASDAIISIDNHWNIIFWNSRAKVMFGYCVDEIADKPIASLISQRFYEDFEVGRKFAVATGKHDIFGKVVVVDGLSVGHCIAAKHGSRIQQIGIPVKAAITVMELPIC